ncbi:MAG TPA: hypothetical protein VGM89_12340 [Puia sp.]|jgi:hypothetical protein
MKRKKQTNPLERLATAVGAGLIAGLAGTAAMTISQMIEMKITKRKPDTTPVDAVEKTIGVTAVSEAEKPMVTQEIHWTYGASWGVSRGLLAMSGLRSWPATLVHFSAVWGASMVMMPALELGPPVKERDPKSLLIEGWHHAVYAAVVGFVFDAIVPSKR